MRYRCLYHLARSQCRRYTTAADVDLYVPRRALLYVPMHTEKMMNKVAQMEADCVVLELEDGVALNAKPVARNNAVRWLKENKNREYLPAKDLGLRVNSLNSGLLPDDLEVIAQAADCPPDSFMVPKIDSVADLQNVARLFREKFGRQSIESMITENNTRLVIWIESGRALIDMRDIFDAGHCLHRTKQFFKLDAAVFGSDDFCADIGAVRSNHGEENLYARQAFVTAAKTYDIQAIDSVYIDLKDFDGLKAQSLQGASWGFTGKQVIHPTQVPVVHACFAPTQEQTEWATELIKQFNEHQRAGKGAFVFRGHMIDKPLLKQAHNVVTIHECINR